MLSKKLWIELFLFQIIDEQNEEAAYNQHRELDKTAQERPHQELKKTKHKHRYTYIYIIYFILIDTLTVNSMNIIV